MRGFAECSSKLIHPLNAKPVIIALRTKRKNTLAIT